MRSICAIHKVKLLVINVLCMLGDGLNNYFFLPPIVRGKKCTFVQNDDLQL